MPPLLFIVVPRMASMEHVFESCSLIAFFGLYFLSPLSCTFSLFSLFFTTNNSFFSTSNFLTTGKLTGMFEGTLIGGIVGDFVGRFVGEFVGGSAGGFVGECVGGLVGGFVGDFVGKLVGGFVSEFVGGLVGRFVGGLIGRLVGGLIGRLVGDFVGGVVGKNVGGKIGTFVRAIAGCLVGGYVGGTTTARILIRGKSLVGSSVDDEAVIATCKIGDATGLETGTIVVITFLTEGNFVGNIIIVGVFVGDGEVLVGVSGGNEVVVAT